MQLQTRHIRNSYARLGKKKITYKNGQTTLSLGDLSAPSYEEVMASIKKKVGDRPIFPKDLPKGNWTEQSLKVLEERYLVKDENLKPIETPEEMVWRVAWEVASAEARWGKKRNKVIEIAKRYYNLMVSREFLPNSPTLMNANPVPPPVL